MTNRLPPDRNPLKSALADRLAKVRRDLYGEHGRARARPCPRPAPPEMGEQ